MGDITAIITTVRSIPAVASLRPWQGKRTYVTVRGATLNGDKSFEAYIDHDSGDLCVRLGKGSVSRSFAGNLLAVTSAYPGAVRRPTPLAVMPWDEGFTLSDI